MLLHDFEQYPLCAALGLARSLTETSGLTLALSGLSVGTRFGIWPLRGVRVCDCHGLRGVACSVNLPHVQGSIVPGLQGQRREPSRAVV